MNWKSTVVLVILAAGAGVWLWKGDEWAPDFGRRPVAPEPQAVAALESDLAPDTVTHIEVTPPGGEPFVLDKGPKGWTQPGNWPLRAAEVNELVAALANLRTRFQPLPAADAEALAAFGLSDAQKPLVVKVQANGNAYALKFGEPPPGAGDTAFTRPAFVQINGAPEVLKLGPDVMPVLRRSAESYRRRQLFSDVARVKLPGAPAVGPPGAPPESAPVTVSLPGDGIEEISVTGKGVSIFGLTPWYLDGRFTLKRTGPTPSPTAATKGAEPVVQPARLADAWELLTPVRDRTDPAALRQVLAAVPELWVEDFVPTAQGGALAEQPFAVAQLLPVPVEPFPGLAARLAPETVLSPQEQLKKSKESVTVRLKDGTAVTVKFGGVAKVAERDEVITIPNPMGGPPRTITQKVPTEFRYAQIEGNPQIFTVSADKLRGLFAKAGELVDSTVARFKSDEVQTVAIAAPGKPPLKLVRKKGSPKSAKDEDKQDRWLIEQEPNPLPADQARVDDLISKLAAFSGSNETSLYHADAQKQVLDPAAATVVTVTAREKRPDGEPDAPAREYTLAIGKPDFAKGVFPVQLAGWPRVSLIEDRLPNAVGAAAGWLGPKLFPERVSALFSRPAVAYRGTKLLDTADAKLTSVTATGENPFAIKKEKIGERDVWKLTQPIASDTDPASVANLLNQLTNLQATEFVAEKTAPLAQYGLDKPKLTVQFRFDDERTYKLEVGAPRPGKQNENFARLDGGDVFGLPTTTTEALAAGPVKLLPLQVWAVTPDKVTAAEITRPDAPSDSFALTKDGTNWKLTGPFEAPVPFLNAQPVLTGLGLLSAIKYEALSAADPAKYGFDKPLAKVKFAYTEKAGGADKAVTKTVVIGGVTPGGADRYAKLDEPNSPVFVIPAAYLAGVQTSPLGLLDRNLLFLDPAKIAKVQIAGDKPESAVTLAKDDKGKWAAEGAAFAIDPVVVGQLVSALAPLPVERLAAYGDAVKWADYGLDKPAFTLTVALDGAKAHTVQLGKPAPGGGRFVRVDGGKAVGVVPEFAVAALARTKLEFADRTLLAFDPLTLNGFARTKGKEELELAPSTSGVGWDVVKPAKQKADQPLMDELAEQLARSRAEKVVAFGKKEDVFKQYGLEPPLASVTLTVGEKAEQKVLRLGRAVDPAKPEAGHYVAIEGAGADAAVGVLPAALANKLLAPAVSFRDRAMLKFVDADQLVLTRGERKITFAKVAGTWKVKAPLTADAEQAALDELVNEFAKLRASDWVAEPGADLKPFGLDKPEATWTVSNGDKEIAVLHLGKTAPDGRVYARVGDKGLVALLGKPQSVKALAEYRVRKPWALDAFQAEKIEFTRGDKTFTLQKSGAVWADPDAPADVISTPAVTELLGTLTALQVERYAVDEGADPKLFGLEKPELVIAVTSKDGSRRELAIGGVVGGTGDKQRYARVLDKARADVFVLSATDTARLARDRAVYVQKK